VPSGNTASVLPLSIATSASAVTVPSPPAATSTGAGLSRAVLSRSSKERVASASMLTLCPIAWKRATRSPAVSAPPSAVPECPLNRMWCEMSVMAGVLKCPRQ